MINWGKILIDGAFLSVIAALILLLILRFNPRILLNDYPKDVQAVAAPKTPTERKWTLLVGIPYLLVLLLVPFFSTLSLKPQNGAFVALFVNAFGVAFIFNLVDWLLLDWLLFCTITPKFVMLPGTEGMAGYKDYAIHFRGFLIGTLLSAICGAAIAGVVWLIG